MFDRFTLAHAAIGCAYAAVGFGCAVAITLAVGWELVENPLKARFPRLFPHATRDTIRNACGDVLAVTAGWAAVRLLVSAGQP